MLVLGETKANRGNALATLKDGLEYCVFGEHWHPFNHLGRSYIWTRPIPSSISGSISHAAAFNMPTGHRSVLSRSALIDLGAISELLLGDAPC